MQELPKGTKYRVLLGPPAFFGPDKNIGYVYSRTFVGMYFKVLLQMWKWPMGSGSIEVVGRDGMWKFWSERNND